ncbi:MAG TPA: pyridoxal 5'-phosphate synthase [Actinocatenispora sp.]
MTVDGGVRDVLRGLPVLTGSAPPFEVEHAPEDPVELFTAWLAAAVEAGVAEPHAMTLSTVDASGTPDARVLILKDVDAAGWHVAVSAVSSKGADLAAHPVAALTFYWPPLARQVRVRGAVVADPPEVRRADFLARPAGSRAMALTLRQSRPLTDPAELDRAVAEAEQRLELDPDLVPDEWVSYAVRPRSVEFWQGDRGRRHQRLRYERVEGSGWTRTRLWP